MNKIIILISAFIISNASLTHAALSLSVNPVRGGSTVRFGRVSTSDEVSKEVRLRITSTDGKQYQVFQRLEDQFRNEKNTSLGRNAMQTYSLIGTNSFGTLYAQSPEALTTADQLLYSSGPGGDGDAFTVVYKLNGQNIDASGQFLGRIFYTVRQINGSSQDNVNMNVTLEVKQDFKVDVESSSGSNQLRLSHDGQAEAKDYLSISFEGNLGEEVQIFQELTTFPQDELLNELKREVINFRTSGETQGQLYNQASTPLERRRVLLYSSKENEDEFLVNLFLDSKTVEQQKAGTYRGQITYIVEAENSDQEFNIDVNIVIAPIFTIEVDLPPEGVSFKNLLPNSPPMISEVEVSVRSNLGRPYMLMQNTATALTNKKGAEIPEEYFTMRGELSEGATGKVSQTDFEPIATGEMPIYFSDSNGSSSRFKIIYRLRSFLEILAGDYSTAIRYSFGEI